MPAADPIAFVHTHLGPDALQLEELQGAEGLSRLFSFDLTLLSKRNDIAFQELAGEEMSVSIAVEGGKKRFLHGIVAGYSQRWIAEADGRGFDLSRYTVRLVPRLWLLTRSRGSRIFQELSVPEIVSTIMEERGITDYRFDFDPARYPPREYCVQYRETEWDFIARLLEDEGIHFWFEHEEGKHVWALGDETYVHQSCPIQGTARYRTAAGELPDGAVLTELVLDREVRVNRSTLKDFDFLQPTLDLTVVEDAREPGPGVAGDRESYDYPGTHASLERGERLVGVRMEEEEAQAIVLSGSGHARAFAAGYLFTMESESRGELNGKRFLLTAVDHHLVQPGFHTGRGSGGTLQEPHYSNRFRCIPAEVHFRPPRTTPRPIVQGPQTAIVVGPEGVEVYPDSHGRVKVQFHWDREGKRNEASSCWVRVSQVWAGHGWGGMHIPHVGHEVIVEFLEGNPDRPLITGRVYHAGNPVPEPLPDAKHKSIFRDDYGNELIFDATPGDEHIRLHSPHHTSTLTLGRSFGGFTESEHFDFKGGNTVELGVGNKFEAFGGNSFEGTIGISNEAKLALVNELLVGGKLEVLLGYAAGFHVGPEFKLHRGPSLEAASDSVGTYSKGNIVYCATDRASLVGGIGKKTPLGPAGATSVLEADRKRISMSIGPNKDPGKMGIDTVEEVAAISMGVLIAATAAASMTASTLITEYVNDVAKAPAMGVALLAEAGILTAEALIFMFMLQGWDKQVLPVSHRDDPGDSLDAVVSLEEKGTVDIYGKSRVSIGVESAVLDRIGKPLTGGAQSPPLPAKGPEIEIKQQAIAITGSGIGPTRSRLNIDNTGVWIETKKGFDVMADSRVRIKCLDFTVNGKNLQVLP